MLSTPKPFKLILTLNAPFHMRTPVTLDGLLSAAVYRETGLMGADTIAHIPLVYEDGIAKGSALHHGKRFTHTNIERVQGFRGPNDLSVDTFQPNIKAKGGGYGVVDTMRGPYKANMDLYPAIEVPEVWFWGVGNGAECARLVRQYIPGIGKRSNAGAGQIVSVFCDPEDDDFSWITPAGTPARQLPTSVWRRIAPGVVHPIAALPVTVPYWESAAVEAVYPLSVSV